MNETDFVPTDAVFWTDGTQVIAAHPDLTIPEGFTATTREHHASGLTNFEAERTKLWADYHANLEAFEARQTVREGLLDRLEAKEKLLDRLIAQAEKAVSK
jgi:hypothetical protein